MAGLISSLGAMFGGSKGALIIYYYQYFLTMLNNLNN